MPYSQVNDLPQDVQDALPEHAQEIYKAAFNSAWDQYDEPDERREGRSREETSHAVAWSAVENEYHKDDSGNWVKNSD